MKRSPVSEVLSKTKSRDMLEVKMYDDLEFRKRNEKFGHKKIEFIEIEMDPGNWSTHLNAFFGSRTLLHYR